MDIVKFFKCGECLSYTHYLEHDYRNWLCHQCDYKTGVTLDDLKEIESLLNGIHNVITNELRIGIENGS